MVTFNEVVKKINYAILASEMEKLELSRFELKYMKLRSIPDEDIYKLFCTLISIDDLQIIYKNGGNGYNGLGRLVGASAEIYNNWGYKSIDKRFKYRSAAVELYNVLRREHLRRKGLRVFDNGNLYVESKKYINNLRKKIQK